MRTQAKFTAKLTLLALLALGCAGERGGGSAGDEPRYGGTLVVAGPSDLRALNALADRDATTSELVKFALFMPLVRFDEALDYEPWLAESWTWEGDTAVTFHLRGDVRWSDGTPTTARDVAFTLERAKDPETGFANGDLVDEWLSAEVIDERTVRMRVRPRLDALTAWAEIAIMPAHMLDTVAAAQLRTTPFNRAPVTNGPFRFVSGTANERYVFEANPDFPAALGGRPYVDRLVWRVVPENVAQVTEISTGNADLILSPRAEQLAELDAQPGLHAIVKPSRRYAFVGWNGARPPLDDARVRRALTHAMNRPRMLQALRSGHGTLAVGPVAPHHWAFDTTLTALAADTATARALLDEAGVRDRNGDGVREGPDGRPFRIELKIAAGNAFNRDLGEMIRSDLSAVGVRVETRPVEFATLIEDISRVPRRFDAVIMGWEADIRPGLRDLFHSASRGGPFQLAAYANPAADSLMDALDDITDRDRAAPLWSQLQQLLRDDQPWTFLWYAPDLLVMRDRVRGAVMDVRGTFVNVGRWWLDDAPQQ